MRLVLDTNILIAALIKDSLTRNILFLPDFEFHVPEYALEEVNRHRAKIARHSRLKYTEIDLLLSLLLESLAVYFYADNIRSVVAFQRRAGKTVFFAAFEGHKEAILTYQIPSVPEFVFKSRC